MAEPPGAKVIEDVLKNSIAQVTRDPNKILPQSIIVMLTNNTRRVELMPLLKRVLDAISNIDGLDDAISNLLKEKQNTELTQALQELQKKIQTKNIIEMLTNSTRREEVMPLLEDVLVKISKIEGLDEAITNVFKTKGDPELTQALQELQKKMRSIYTATYKSGGKRRRTKKRKHYKKRRSTKHR